MCVCVGMVSSLVNVALNAMPPSLASANAVPKELLSKAWRDAHMYFDMVLSLADATANARTPFMLRMQTSHQHNQHHYTSVMRMCDLTWCHHSRVLFLNAAQPMPHK